ncbi:TRAP transporter substrate-binding protein DctP [Wenxinia marina]|uniref:TRAP-type C4-dicarboxylate transport system, periplasmic component n=1 Tax=Wenxinia marina DSM 24838 TaxID=1123501 RepID=A0A0D0Q9F6_9RHOB|nr:TRAP transporter substrate-binding protein DctP [Wenxinia marina]KIQ69002.1 TRAP-type C4-dicarboxylate transport system, periplasmic component [Wenxinia marina DSM 24838]
MKLLSKTAILSAATALAGGTLSAQELQYSTHLPPVVGVNSAGIQPLFERVSEATGGEITVKYFWAGQLFDAAGNFEAIRDGVIDMAFTQPEDAQADMPANLIFSDLYFIGDNPYATAAAANETILLDCQTCRDEYANNNAMFMGTHATTPTKMSCAADIQSMDDLQGRKVIGQTTLAEWVATFNGTQLDVPPPARLEAMERGVADCTIITPEWLDTFSLGEVVQTVIDVPNGSQFAISIATTNAETWEGLSDEAQAAFLEAMPHAIEGIVDNYVERDAAALEKWQAEGLTVTDLGGAYEEALDAYLVGYEQRVIEGAQARGVENAEEIVNAFLENLEKWNAIIEEQGTENYAQLLWDEIYSQVDY